MTDFIAPVSVVIPCFLCRDTIERAVLSVMGQTMLPREILLVDDASPDGGATVRELQSLAQQHESLVSIRVVLLPENAGPGSARNRGWELASQPYIAFLDADDAWLPQKIEYQYMWMRDHPEYFLSCHHQVLINPACNKIDLLRTYSSEIAHQEVSSKKLLYFNLIPTRTVMMRRDAPFKFPEGKRYSEDYFLWLTIVLSGLRAAKIESILAATFKPDFGAAGLSSKLLSMELGVLDCYLKIYKLRLINFFSLISAILFSLIKFCRRIFLTAARKLSL